MKLKIAQVAPLYESVPPKLYGGTERIVSYLTEALVKSGQEVTLFASGDSVTKARLIPICDTSLRLTQSQDSLSMHVVQLQEVIDRALEFDIIHFHTDYLHFPVSRLMNLVSVTTLHGRLDIPELQPVYSKFPNAPVISISNSQRQPLSIANWVATVYHGLPLDLYKKGNGEGNYAVFLGRISPEKRPDRAIEIARLANLKIKIAAKVDPVDRPYFEENIKSLLDLPHVEFLGEINEDEKGELLRHAKALLFPIDWPEPFGIVMIEAMASGTPVIAYNCGSVPEIITPGKTGYIVNNLEDAAQALLNIKAIDRQVCRDEFEDRFSADRMAQDYYELYVKMIHQNKLERLQEIYAEKN